MSTMHAIQVHTYGDATQLRLEQISQPKPQEGDVLVRVHAAGVNALDWKIRSGLMKSVMPSTFPYVPGIELAGVVERVGPGVTTFQPGQAVYGHTAGGAYAEYSLVPAQTLAPKPTSLTFDDAATVPIGALTAWQALFDSGQLQAGQRVLILGGSGGVGIFAVQFAHSKGAYVITTTSTSNVDFVQALGADTVIDYTQMHVEDAVQDVDLVFDTVGDAATASALATLSLAAAKVVRQYPSYSPKQTLWLLFKEERTIEEQRFVQNVLEQSQVIAHAYDYVRRFRQILTERDETALQSWACEAEAGQIPELVRFVQRLRLDWEAIENALLFASSQGQVEGQVNRLKIFKRQGYGRTSPALLQARLIGASGLSRNAS